MQSTDEYKPINAISTSGTIFEIKAITDDNKQLDVKGVSRSGNIVNVKAINENGEFLDVHAFGPKGKIDHVKGIKIFDREVEMKVQGHPVYAHLKALNQ
jgi:hydrogenase maturation factor